MGKLESSVVGIPDEDEAHQIKECTNNEVKLFLKQNEKEKNGLIALVSNMKLEYQKPLKQL